MPRNKKKKKQIVESDSESSISEWDPEEMSFKDILKIFNSHNHWDLLLRDERLFESGLFEDMDFVKELWNTRNDAKARKNGLKLKNSIVEKKQ
tara:strand:- start:28 stop:306 length:279 start_codon:yes stop_codon:yes gene_type:complete